MQTEEERKAENIHIFEACSWWYAIGVLDTDPNAINLPGEPIQTYNNEYAFLFSGQQREVARNREEGKSMFTPSIQDAWAAFVAERRAKNGS